MTIRVSIIVACCALLALLVPARSRAQPEIGPPSPGDTPDPGEARNVKDRWIPSLAIMGGANFQKQDGSIESLLLEGDPPADPVPLREPDSGDEVVVAPFVGAALEILTPELPVPTSPRIFLSGEILPTFASTYNLTAEGQPGCIRGPEPGAPCASEETGDRTGAFGETGANGQGSRTSAEIDTLVYGASLGVAFPVEAWSRQVRIKPAVAWLSYEVEASGVVVNAACDPRSRCTDTMPFPGVTLPGFLREETLSASESQRFNSVGPGLDVEVDTGSFGPIGSSLFLGARAYRVLGDRTISFSDTETYDDQIGTDAAVARWEVEVAPWIYRAHVGLRLHWLGFEN